jgi:hypothetical protein
LPATVRGPVDLRELRRLAASKARVRLGDLRNAMLFLSMFGFRLSAEAISSQPSAISLDN